MAANTETSIWLAIKSRIDTLLTTYPKAYPGQTFTPPFSGSTLLPYLRIGRVVAPPANQFYYEGQPHRREGFIIITLVTPLGQNVSVYDQIAGDIAQHFNDAVKMTYGSLTVSIPTYPHVLEGYEDNGYWTVPVRVPWLCIA